MKLKNKTILITGASSGIGEAMAYKAAADGATVILSARRKDRLENVANKVKELGGIPVVIECDVTKPDQVKRMFLEAVKNERKLDVVFNNAGLGHIGTIYQLTAEQIGQMVDVNFKGMAWVTKYAAEVMTRQKFGHIIITSSLAGFVTLPQWSIYAGTKWAIRGFAGSIRHELKPYNIKITTLHPGAVKTEFFDKEKANIDIKNLGNAISSEQVANAVYKAIFTNKKRILVPGSVKIYAWLSNYLTWLVDAMVARMASKIKYHKGIKEDEPEFN